MERKSRLPHWIRILICVFGYWFYFSIVLGFGMLMVPLALLFSPFVKPGTFFHKGMHLALGGLVKQFLPLIRVCRIVSFKNRDALSYDGPAIVIGNHRGWLDGPVVISHVEGLTPIMKEGYAKNPFYRTFTTWFEFISVNANSQESIKRAKEDSRTILSQGKKMLIFPEGSRSKTKKMLPFRRLAFQLATEFSIPVIPILQSSDTPFMAKGDSVSYFPKREILLHISVLDPVFPEENETADQFTGRVEKLMIKELRKLDQECC